MVIVLLDERLDKKSRDERDEIYVLYLFVPCIDDDDLVGPSRQSKSRYTSTVPYLVLCSTLYYCKSHPSEAAANRLNFFFLNFFFVYIHR